MKSPRAALALATATLLPALARADELADRVRMLFSTQFAFSSGGLPIMTVRLMEHQTEVAISGDVRILPLGEGGPELRSSGQWRVTLESGRPARMRYWTVLDRVPIADKAGLASALARWRERGMDPQTFEVGNVFGIAGEVLDRRAVVVVTSPYPTAAEAEHEADALRKRLHTETSVHAELYERPQGTLVARGPGGAELRSASMIWFAPATPAGRLTAHQVEFGVGYPNHGREDRAYWGKLYVTVDRAGTLALVNAVPEDKLLSGLVPAEMYASAPEEALKAQTVAARNELLAKIGSRHLGDPYLLCSSQHCQVYSGAGKEHPRTTAAVAATRGQILFHEGTGEMADTVYSASCGGFTESNENAWDDMSADPALRGRPDVAGPRAEAFARFGGAITEANIRDFLAAAPAAFCKRDAPARGDRYRWTIRRSAAEAAELVRALSIGALRELRVTARGVSGRAKTIEVVGERGTKEVRGELRIRQLFGGLPSSMFVVDTEPGAFVFRGGGFGHGVGLCQTGAIGMAEAGYKYTEILRHYYRGTKIRKLY
jgi:SpoIID/LytB domain protein